MNIDLKRIYRFFSQNKANAHALSSQSKKTMNIKKQLESSAPLKWLFYGDSITQGSLHTSGQRSYVELFSERIRYELGRTLDIITNTAISGNTSKDLLEQFKWRVEEVKPDIIFIMVGMNDCNKQKGLSLAEFENNLNKILDLIEDLGASPILQTTCPVLAGEGDQGNYSTLPEYMDVIRQIASDKDLPLIDHFAFWQANIIHHSHWMNNIIHPNGAGHRAFAYYIYHYFDIFDKTAPSCKPPLTNTKQAIDFSITNNIEQTGINIVPIEQRLPKVDNTHQSIRSILNLIKQNVERSRHEKPWEDPRWKSAKITAQHIEEIGLLARLNHNDSEDLKIEAIHLIEKLMSYYKDKNLKKETGDYFELFLSESSIAIIYTLEYFAPFLSIKQEASLEKHLAFTSDTLWELILNSREYDHRTQSRLAWNHSQFVHAVTGICAIKRNNKNSEERLARAILWIEGYMSHTFTWDGFSKEGIFYAGATRMPLLLFLMALKKYKNIDLLQHTGLLNHGQYLINEWVPKSTQFITRNDMCHVKYSTTLSSILTYAHLFQCKKALSLWESIVGEKGDKTFGNPSAENNRNGSLVLNYLFYPSELSEIPSTESYIDSFKVYREAGVVSGYSKASAFKYSFQASSHLQEIHSQSDHGQIYLYLNGDTLLGDTAVGNNRNPNTAGQSEGHNSLMIDGEGMSLSGNGWQSCSILEDTTNHGNYHSMRANLTPAYNANHSRITIAHYKRLVIVHNTEPYHIVVLDSVSDLQNSTHEFTYRFHTDPKHSITHEQENIKVNAPHAILTIVPLGINWKPQKQASFIFNNDHRSSYIDSTFSTEDFVGGYILIPSSKENPTHIDKQGNEVILSTSTHESHIILDLEKSDNIIKCQTRKKNSKENDSALSVKRETNPANSFDFLTGEITTSG